MRDLSMWALTGPGGALPCDYFVAADARDARELYARDIGDPAELEVHPVEPEARLVKVELVQRFPSGRTAREWASRARRGYFMSSPPLAP